MTTIIAVSIHPANDAEFRLEYVGAHDTVSVGYYRLKIENDATVFLSKTQLDDLIAILKRGGD